MRIRNLLLLSTSLLLGACSLIPAEQAGPESPDPDGVEVILEPSAEPGAADAPAEPEQAPDEAQDDRLVDHFLPDISGYGSLEEATLLQAIEELESSGLLEAGSLPEAERQQLSSGAEQGDDILACYAEAGAFAQRSYASESQIFGFGLIGVVDQTQLTSLELIAECIVKPKLGGAMPFDQGAPSDDSIGPCQDKYEVDWEDHSFHVFYAGTTRKVCREICASLEGCVDPYAGSGGSSDS